MSSGGDRDGIVLSALSAFLSSIISSLFSQIKGAPAPPAPPLDLPLYSLCYLYISSHYVTQLSFLPFIQNVETTLVSTFYCAFTLHCSSHADKFKARDHVSFPTGKVRDIKLKSSSVLKLSLVATISQGHLPSQ